MEQSDPSLDAVYMYVEQAYLRMQAGDVLIRCMDEGSIIPMQQIVEGLILAGPDSLAVLREILAEASQRKVQVQDDLHQVYVQFVSSLESYGAYLSGYQSALSLMRLTPRRFLHLLREQDISNKTQIACLQLLQETRSLIKHLAVQLHLLEDIAHYLQDWMWGMVYDAAREDKKSAKSLPNRDWQH